LALHAKPIVFYNPGGFWDPLFALFARFIEQRLMPAAFDDCWRAVADLDQVLPALEAMPRELFATTPTLAPLV
jgi:predicted Rossmann-fold nucleotide-binding protein